MAHGSGGMMSQQLIEKVFKKSWDNPHLEPMLDGALLDLPPGTGSDVHRFVCYYPHIFSRAEI